MQLIRIAAAVVTDDAKRLLLVRKRDTEFFMQPGGKIESREAPVSALCRELYEELGVNVDPNQCVSRGVYRAPAANEIGHEVEAHLFDVVLKGTVDARAEIAEARWVTQEEARTLTLAPLTRDYVLT